MNARPPVVLGIDAGTTAVKVSAFTLDPELSWRHVTSAEYPLLQPHPGWEVQDADQVWQACLAALADCVAALDRRPVLAIGLSTAMHALLGVDADQRPMGPIATWADTRASAEVAELRADPASAELAARTGTPLHPFSPFAKALWFHRHEPATAARVRTWLSLKGWLVWNLTGVLAEELSSASSSGLYDIVKGCWHAEALAVAGITEGQLPPVLATTDARPLRAEVAERVGVPAGTPVVVGAGDGPLGNLGVGALTRGVAGLSLGTSGALRMAVDAPVVDRDPGLFCYALTDRVWTLGGAISNGGLVVRWAGRLLDVTDTEVLERAAAVAPGSDGLVMLPYLVGERAPLWDPTLPGAWLGLRHDHHAGHLVRSAIEGVGRQLALVADLIARVHPIEQVRATGGVFRAALWRDVVAGMIGRPMVVTAGAEGSGLGAAVLALLGTGRVADLAEGLALLDPGRHADTPVEVDPALVATYRAERTRVQPLVRSYEALLPLLQADT